ncbi:MAG: acyl-CoA dehydrogenase [Rhizobiaceae bacterium]
MTEYRAPIEDIRFALDHVANYAELEDWDSHSDASMETASAVLEEAAKLAQDVLSPLNVVGDQQAAKMVGGQVVTPEGSQEAYNLLTEGGWIGLTAPEEFGGMNMPETLGAAVTELWHGANVGFSLNVTLTYGAAAALMEHASEEISTTYVPKLLEGKWTGTMNLTEPQAGSDLGALRCKAEKQSDGTYLISGQKIFISYGDHDLAENIVHLVLARTPDAPAGSRGISLFVVPKFIPDENGNPGQRNQVTCVSLEHKLGLHASPTAVLSFGDEGGATGWIIGEENRGLAYMFVMMNRARFEVGIQGIGVAERAYQRALAYAGDRIQGRPFDRESGVPIIGHPDVRRMLLMMKSQTEAARALALYAGKCMDGAHHHPDKDTRIHYDRSSQFLTPIVKGWSTELATEIASIGIQVHGGLGFIEETGAAQYLRDARILSIYEGTTGIQANDLVFRKLLADEGATAETLLNMIETDIAEQAGRDSVVEIATALDQALNMARKATGWILKNSNSPSVVAAGASPYLRLMGTLLGGWVSLRTASAAAMGLSEQSGSERFLRSKLATARFYADHVLCHISGLAAEITQGSASIIDPEDELL